MATRAVRERAQFLRSFIANPRQVGALLPTSSRAVRAMLDMADLGSADVVAELGAGTGVHTREILPRLKPGAKLLAFEIDPDLAEILRSRLADPRLQVIADSAEKLPDYLDGARPDVIVSALPFTSLPGDVGATVLDRATAALAPGGTLLVLQYSTLILKQLRRRFGSVRRSVCLLNAPPAFLFACTDPIAGRQPSEAPVTERGEGST